MSSQYYKKGAPLKSSNREKAFSNSGYNNNGGQIQNVKAAKVYVFGNDNVAEDENIEFEMPEMRSRHKVPSDKKATCFIEDTETSIQDSYFEKEILDGETLQAIALKYACPVSNLFELNFIRY